MRIQQVIGLAHLADMRRMVLLRNLRDSITVPRASRGDYKLAETLLKAIREHAVQGSPEAQDRFHALISDLSRRMVSTDDDAELVMMAGAAQQALRQFEVETNGFWRGQSSELKGIVSALTAALAEFGDRHSQAAERLVTLEQTLMTIAKLEDLHLVRLKIEDCVQALRLEHKSHASTQAMVAQSVQGVTAKAGERQKPSDPVTGLDTRKTAEEEIGRHLQNESGGVHLALFVVHRIQQINSRYGHAVGDDMLTTFLQHIASSLDAKDQIYRWSGPAFLALLERADGAEGVMREVRRIASYKIDKELEIRDRSVMVPLSASVCLISLKTTSRLAAVAAELDQFASSHLER